MLVNPLTASYLLHFHYSTQMPDNFRSKSGMGAIDRLLELGAIQRSAQAQATSPNASLYETTELGKAWVSAIVNMPAPKPVYVDAHGNIIK